MKGKKKLNRTIFKVLIVVFIVVAGFSVSRFVTGGGNSLCLGWIEHKLSDTWSADYTYFSGTQTSKLHGANTKLHMEVETNSGTLKITVKDKKKHTLFSETVQGNDSFVVDVPKEVTVSVTGKKHDGGFRIHFGTG